MTTYRMECLVCTGTGCVANRAFDITQKLKEEVARRGLEQEVNVVATGCNGFCALGPIVVVQPDGIFYQKLKEKDIPEFVEEHILKGRPVQRLLHRPPDSKQRVPLMNDIGFFSKQLLVALRNRGVVDPENIEDYIARDGYSGLAKVLTEMKPAQVIEEIKKSGLRGRGGGGFPAGIKWESADKAPGDPKYIVCNADEGDPGAFMDRSIIESDPHSMIEGMAIGAYALGTDQGFIYVRKEYPLALNRLRIAIGQAREMGLLGEGIFGTNFNFDIQVHQGAGAFVCGESTALMASMEGRVGEPRAKYIHTVESGYLGKPTVLNNVETWANVPVIMLRGADWFSSIGCKNNAGTKVFSLVGNINNTGLVEVPMGITLREIIFDIGGGIPRKKEFKAVQTGGPSGGCLPASLLDLSVDFDTLWEAGSMMGSGGMIVMDTDTCMVDVARYFLEFLREESCGKCLPCREGIRQMVDILNRICTGQGQDGDIETLENLSQTIIDSSLCALGGSAPNPVLSTLRYFRDEYVTHIRDKKCPAGVCKELVTYSIDAEKCTGCTLCVRECPTNCITGEKKQPHLLDASKCVKCAGCYEVCRFDAVLRN